VLANSDSLLDQIVAVSKCGASILLFEFLVSRFAEHMLDGDLIEQRD
jgi:hypothetical protein